MYRYIIGIPYMSHVIIIVPLCYSSVCVYWLLTFYVGVTVEVGTHTFTPHTSPVNPVSLRFSWS